MLEVFRDVDDPATRRDGEREPPRIRPQVQLREADGTERMTVITAEIEHPVAEIFDHGPAREIRPHRASISNPFETARDGHAAQEVLREDHPSFSILGCHAALVISAEELSRRASCSQVVGWLSLMSSSSVVKPHLIWPFPGVGGAGTSG